MLILEETMKAQAMRVKDRSDKAMLYARWLISLLINEGLKPEEAVDLCLFVAGYVSELKLPEVNPLDALDMIVAGQAKAKLAKETFGG